jgi:hypothetical protein
MNTQFIFPVYLQHIVVSFSYGTPHQIASFKATDGHHLTLQRCSVNSTALLLCYAASSDTSSLVCDPLFVLQRCTILL